MSQPISDVQHNRLTHGCKYVHGCKYAHVWNWIIVLKYA